MSQKLELSIGGRKALCVQLGDAAGAEIADLLKNLAERIERLERGKVDVTPVVPVDSESKGAPRRRRAA